MSRGQWRRWRRILTLIYAAAAIAGLHNYIPLLSPPAIVGMLALLYTPASGKHPPETFRFGWAALMFIACFFFLPVRTILYGALCCAACLLLETFYRRVNATIPMILGLLSPVTAFFVDNFSFPIRLWLTSLAGRLIALAGMPVSVAGSTITVRNHAFSVDHACEGLHILLLSLLTALLVINYYQTQYRRRLRIVTILVLLITTVALNIVANLFRIICLVMLAVTPSNPLHHWLGLVFLLAYILLPLMALVRWTIRRWGVQRPEENAHPIRSRALLAANIMMASAVLLILGLHTHAQKAHGAPLAAGNPVPGYTIKEREDAVLQLDNGRSLVYIKPIPGFYYTDHTPTICWLGGGYSFSAVEDTVAAGTHIFKAVMEAQRPSNDTSTPHDAKPRLYTAWWYDNGIRQSIQPFDWRLDLIRGAPPYAVVNVTASTPQDLDAELIHILESHPFHSLLGRTPTPARVKIW